MRTTPSIADDGLAAAKAPARKQQRSVEEIVSELARRSLSRGGRERNQFHC